MRIELESGEEVDTRKLNEAAIRDGLLLPGNKSLREDYSTLLGSDLSQLESRCYELINTSPFPISTDEVYSEIYGTPSSRSDLDRKTAWELIYRVKQKLGGNAVIYRNGVGYSSRRHLISQGKRLSFEV